MDRSGTAILGPCSKESNRSIGRDAGMHSVQPTIYPGCCATLRVADRQPIEQSASCSAPSGIRARCTTPRPSRFRFLGELAASDDVDGEIRFLLLALIFAIGRGKGYWQVHADGATQRPDTPDNLPAVLEAEREWVQACKEAVRGVADEFIENLSTWPDRLWLAVATLVVVAGEAGRASVDGIIAESDSTLAALRCSRPSDHRRVSHSRAPPRPAA